jgi:hypothetical protein
MRFKSTFKIAEKMLKKMQNQMPASLYLPESDVGKKFLILLHFQAAISAYICTSINMVL